MEKNPYIELAECLLPEEMVEYFDVVKVEKTSETLDVTLEERDNGVGWKRRRQDERCKRKNGNAKPRVARLSRWQDAHPFVRVYCSSSPTLHWRMFADLARSANSVGVSHRCKYSFIRMRGIGSVESQPLTIRRAFKSVVVGSSPTTTHISYSIGWTTIRARAEN